METDASGRRRGDSRYAPLLSSTFPGSGWSSVEHTATLSGSYTSTFRMPNIHGTAMCFASNFSPRQEMDVLRPGRWRRCCVRVGADEVSSVLNTRVEYVRGERKGSACHVLAGCSAAPPLPSYCSFKVAGASPPQPSLASAAPAAFALSPALLDSTA